jgi:hypothetical protein
MTSVVNCETMDMFSTLKVVAENTTVKGTNIMPKDDDDRRLTPVERGIRDRCANVPKHRRRSIDAYRQALGFTPLWGSSLERERKRR